MNFDDLVQDITTVHVSTRSAAARSVDRLMTLRNWLLGACIVEYEQNGEDRAAYGTGLLQELARTLRRGGHKGLGVSNLRNFRQVTLTWPGLDVQIILPQIIGAIQPLNQIHQTASGESPEALSLTRLQAGFRSLKARAKVLDSLEWQDQAWLQRLFTQLSFSHLLELSRVDKPLKRAFYELHCLKERWVVRDLQRQRDSMLYERVGLSTSRESVLASAREGVILKTPEALLRDPYILEFLGLRESTGYREAELEQKLIDHLQAFLHELGRDFCFVDRQFRITVGGRHHFLDLLFYHRGLRCLIAIDLKLGSFRHEHAGQMHFYLNYLADQVAHPDENPPVGILLCTDKDAAEVHYATAGLEQSVFVSRYMTELPTEERLGRWLSEERSLLETHGLSPHREE